MSERVNHYMDEKERKEWRRDHFIKTTEVQNALAQAIEKDINWYTPFMDLIEHYCDSFDGCGGNLHVVLDDDNIDDHSLAWCSGYCAAMGDHEGGDIANFMEMMTISQRERVLEDE